METLNKEKELIEKIVSKIKDHVSHNVEVININDYTDERKDHMISVGISNTINANPMLPDYQYTVDILVDSYIDKDRYGQQFEQNKSDLLSYLEPILMNRNRLGELFDEIPIVGCFLNGINNMTTEDSNQSRISLRVIASYPI